MPIQELALDPDNARDHSGRSVSAIAESFREFGQLKPVVANRKTKRIAAGNGAYKAAMQLGWSHLAVVWVDHDATTHRRFGIADNRVAEISDWDGPKLEELMLLWGDGADELKANLLIDELLLSTPPPEPDTPPEDPPGTKFEVVIECADRSAQEKIAKQLRGDGWTVRRVKK